MKKIDTCFNFTSTRVTRQFFSMVIAVTTLFFSLKSFGQRAVTPPPLASNAHWISHPHANKNAYGVFHFRKTIELKEKPRMFLINISGDQRFRLFVNGKSVAVGSARSDVSHWRYQKVDIASFLDEGKNTLAAVVWNDGENSAWAQMSYQTGLLIFGESGVESVANTDASWKVIENLAYSPQSTIAHITGAFENLFAQRYPWGWENGSYDDSDWLVSLITEDVIFSDKQHLLDDTSTVRRLALNALPMPEEKLQRIETIRKVTGLENVTDNFLKDNGALAVHPWAKADILLDQTYLTSGFIKMLVSGGKGAKIDITYAESLVDEKGSKGNRNQIVGKHIVGNNDTFIADGGNNRSWTTLYYRTYRYILLHIENHQQPLEIKEFYGVFTAYPFEKNANFICNDSIINKIWNVGWRTARLCAYETYMDCPYYEQLQYVGDTRIQALVSLYLSGDDRLMKNAIEQIAYSMLPEGITQSRYPSTNLQIIPPFSLFWISMIHDYWMHKSDDQFIKDKIVSRRKILGWHQRYVNAEDMLGKTPYWSFVDWPRQWPWTGNESESGIPAGAKEGKSSILSLQYVMALQNASELMRAFGFKKDALLYTAQARAIRDAVYSKCWDTQTQRMADVPEKNAFSQHAQALSVLTGAIGNNKATALLRKTFADTSLIQCTYYYRFYLFQALKKAGLENEYLENLGPWKKMLDLGLTTFAEAPEPTRSDCHGWSASPCYDFLATVSGITPASPGFKTIQIKPAPGKLTHFEASMPHPNGVIEVTFKNLNGTTIEFDIKLPISTSGVLVWQQNNLKLNPGKNRFIF